MPTTGRSSERRDSPWRGGGVARFSTFPTSACEDPYPNAQGGEKAPGWSQATSLLTARACPHRSRRSWLLGPRFRDARVTQQLEVEEVGFPSRGSPYRPIAVGASSSLVQALTRGGGGARYPTFPTSGYLCSRSQLPNGTATAAIATPLRSIGRLRMLSNQRRQTEPVAGR